MKFQNIKPKVQKQEVSQAPKRKGLSWKLKLSMTAFCLILLFIGMTFLAMKVSQFYDNNRVYFQAPIIVQAPIVIEKRKQVIISPIATGSAQVAPAEHTLNIFPRAYAYESQIKEAEIINKHEHKFILWRVYQLESSFGKNDGCKEKGQFNGFGYAQSTFTWNCFDSFEEVVGKVDNWFTDKFEKGMSVAEALCYYNEGVQRADCPYYKNYLTL